MCRAESCCCRVSANDNVGVNGKKMLFWKEKKQENQEKIVKKPTLKEKKRKNAGSESET